MISLSQWHRHPLLFSLFLTNNKNLAPTHGQRYHWGSSRIHKPMDAGEVLSTCAQVIGRKTFLPAIDPAVAHELAPASLCCGLGLPRINHGWGSLCGSPAFQRKSSRTRKEQSRTSLVVQWLRILLAMQRTWDSIPGQGTKIPAEQLSPWATTTEPTCHN